MSGVKQKASQAHTGMRKAEKRMKDIAGIQNAIAVCQEQMPVHDKYLKIGWKKRQAAFAESHQEELKAYNKAYRYLKAQHIDVNVNLDALEAEYSKLQSDHAAFARQLEQVQAELKPLNEIRYWVGQVLGAEQVESLAVGGGTTSSDPQAHPETGQGIPERTKDGTVRHPVGCLFLSGKNSVHSIGFRYCHNYCTGLGGK